MSWSRNADCRIPPLLRTQSTCRTAAHAVTQGVRRARAQQSPPVVCGRGPGREARHCAGVRFILSWSTWLPCEVPLRLQTRFHAREPFYSLPLLAIGWGVGADVLVRAGIHMFRTLYATPLLPFWAYHGRTFFNNSGGIYSSSTCSGW